MLARKRAEVGLPRYRVWLDRALSLVTLAVGVVAAYVLATERVIPALRGEPAVVEVGETLPGAFEFELLERQGDRVAVPGGRATLLLFYNSTCPACYANLPSWQTVIDAVGVEVSVLAVALEGERPAARAYARRHLPGALGVVPEDAREVTGRLGIGIVPSTALVGPSGALRYVRQGSLDRSAVDSLVRALEALGGLSP